MAKRFKKGSKEAKAWGARMKRLRNKTKSKKSRSSPIRRRKISKSRTRTMPKRKRKVSRKSSSMWGINVGNAGAAGLYGAVRARLSNFLAPYTARIPAGVVSDEVGMVISTQLLKKMVFKKAGIVRNALTMGQAIEFARIGEAIATGQINLGGLAPAQSNGNLF